MAAVPRLYEPVYTVSVFFDRPRAGIAAFDGVPHTYQAVFDEALDAYVPDNYDLQPVDAETLSLALEAAAIVDRREAAHRAGTLPPIDDQALIASGSLASVNALPVDAARAEALASLLDRRLKARTGSKFRALGDIRRCIGARDDAATWQLEVQWTLLPA